MRLSNGWLAIGAALAFMALSSAPARTQIQFKLGGADELAVAYLQSRGFSEIRIVRNEFFRVRAEACKDGTRYKLQLRIDGRIHDLVGIGNCGAITTDQAHRILTGQGYRRIEIDVRNNKFVAFGCKGEDRFRVVMDLSGQIGRTKRAGRCRDVLSPGDVAAKLGEQGFDRIKFTDAQLPEYVATACFGQARFELMLNGKGEILREQRIGRCRSAIDPRDLVAALEGLGYSRIEMIDRQLPRYVAEACRNGERVEVTLDRFGNVRKEKSLGRCASRLSREQLVEILADRGFARVTVTDENSSGFTVEVCLRRQSKQMQFDIYGDIIEERDLGRCKSRRVEAIFKQLESRGFSGSKIYVEGCRGNRRIQFELDQLGELGRRQRLGSC